MIIFLVHQWKEKIRSPFWRKSIFLNILLAIFGIYLMLVFALIGFFADKILLEVYGNCDVVQTFTRLLLYYFAFDLIMRFLFQQLPSISIQPYLTLPIKKSTLLHYPLIKSLSSFFNVFALLLILPFFIKNIYPAQTILFSSIWLFTVLFLITINNFLNFSLKKYFSERPILTVLFLIAVGTSLYFDINKGFSLSGYFSTGFTFLLQTPWLVLIPSSGAIFCYFLAYTQLRNNAYLEDLQGRSVRKANAFSFLTRYGELGQLIRIELKMILRNKRPRSLLYITGIFALYGFMFYKKEELDNDIILSFTGIIMSSLFSMNYGQFFFSWESSFFDGYLSNRVSPYNYIKSKYLFFAISSTIMFVVTLPYAFISSKIGFINAAFLLYNLGITSVLILFFSTFNTSYIDLGKGQFMNYQGTGVSNFLVIVPVAGIPFLLYFLFKTLEIFQYFYYAVAFIGLTGIALNRYFLHFIVGRFMKRKYKMALGFRQK